MNLSEKKVSDIDEKQIIRGFILTAKEGLATKEDILERYETVTAKIEQLNGEMADLQTAGEQLLSAADEQNVNTVRGISEEYGSSEDIQKKYTERRKERDAWVHLMTQLEELMSEKKNFDKSVCFSNIRELLRQNPDVKIGQIEKEAGIRLGYMSRLEKDGNKSEPSMEFIVTAAKLLKVSLDTLVSVNLTGLTPTEQYLVNFFDKLKADTIADKLDWIIESPDYLNRLDTDMNGYVDHPLFDMETFYEQSECEYPDEVTRVVFTSHSFGPKTFICGDCFNLRMKNGTTLYLMDIEKSVHKVNDQNAYAKEIWTYTPHVGCQFLVSNKDETPIAPLVDTLFSIVKERMQHPKLNKAVMYAIDSFMRDDLGDDDDGDQFPF